MPLLEFSRCAIRLVGTPVEWKTRLAHLLGVTSDQIDAWAAGRAPIPDAIRRRLAMSTDGHDDSATIADEWIRGRGLAPTNTGPHDFLLHAHAPRFLAPLVEDGADDDDRAWCRRAVRLDEQTWLGEVVWLDPEPGPDEIRHLMAAAADALAADAGHG